MKIIKYVLMVLLILLISANALNLEKNAKPRHKKGKKKNNGKMRTESIYTRNVERTQNGTKNGKKSK